MMVQMTGVGPMTGQLVHFIRFAPKGVDNAYALSRYKTQVMTLYKTLEERLAKTRYLGGAEYGIADIATFPWARATEMFAPGFNASHPNVARWVAEIAARPAVVKAIAAADEVRGRISAFDKVPPENIDRVMGRGTFAAA